MPKSDETDRIGTTFRTFTRWRREAMGLSQTELARRMTERGHAFHQTQIAKIESGTRPVSLAEAVALSAILGEPLERTIEPQLRGLDQVAVETEIWAATADLTRLEGELLSVLLRVNQAMRAMESAEAERRALELEIAQVEQRKQAALDRLTELRGQVPDEDDDYYVAVDLSSDPEAANVEHQEAT